MSTFTSPDGTTIAYEATGNGPAVILVDGGMCYRAAGPMRPLAALLQEDFTVYTYDRRGRGESTDTLPFAVEREVEDLQSLVAQAGGQASVYGISSGAALAIRAAAADRAITGLALYEPPFLAEVEPGPRYAEYSDTLRALLAAGRRGDAVELFMTHVGLPPQMISGMRAQPSWAMFEAIAPTLAYDDAALNGARVPRDVAAAVEVPAILLAGSASPQGLQLAAKATAEALSDAEFLTLHGQTHDVAPEEIAPVLADFFGRDD